MSIDEIFYLTINQFYDNIIDWIPIRVKYQELKNDIIVNGIKEPLDVRLLPIGKYLIIDGYHRFCIAKEIGIQTLPCRIASRGLINHFLWNKEKLGKLINEEELIKLWDYLPEQNIYEIKWLIKRLGDNLPLNTILELGTNTGGSLKIWEQLLPQNKDSLLISIDIEPKVSWDYINSLVDVKIIKGKTEDVNIRNQVKEILNGRKVDFLFIDTRHWNDAVREDLLQYGGFVRDCGIIALHDTAFFHSFWDKLTWDKPIGNDNIPFHPVEKDKFDLKFHKEEIKVEYGIGILWKTSIQNTIEFIGRE